MTPRDWLELGLIIIICGLAGIIGTFFTIPAIPTWYAALNKPFFNPPSWVFGPVWIMLYALMGISFFIIWKKGLNKKENKIAVSLFSAQLVLNALWSIIFFGLQNILFALIEIIMLWIFLVITIIKFYKIDKRAAYLLVPYVLWVSFATILTFFIFILN
jgi:translocator protein